MERDLRVIQLRNYMDPKHHYKSNDHRKKVSLEWGIQLTFYHNTLLSFPQRIKPYLTPHNRHYLSSSK